MRAPSEMNEEDALIFFDQSLTAQLPTNPTSYTTNSPKRESILNVTTRQLNNNNQLTNQLHNDNKVVSQVSTRSYRSTSDEHQTKEKRSNKRKRLSDITNINFNDNDSLKAINKIKLIQKFLSKFKYFPIAFKNIIIENYDNLEALIIALTNLKESDFSEDDPILLVIPNFDDINSINYFNGGNFGLNADVPGALVWPADSNNGNILVQGLDATRPLAFGRYLSQQPGFSDISNGHGVLFKVNNLRDYAEASGRLVGSRQFRRIGPVLAQQFNIQGGQQLPYINVTLLTSLNAAPQIMTHFNYLP